MTYENVSKYISPNPDAQKGDLLGDDITHSQELQILPDRLPKSLVEWLVRINRRYLAVSQKKKKDSS